MTNSTEVVRGSVFEEEHIDRFLPEMFRTRDVCELLQVSEGTLRKWMKEGRIRFIRVGGTTRFQQTDIRNFLKKNQRLVGSEGDER